MNADTVEGFVLGLGAGALVIILALLVGAVRVVPA